MNWNTYKLLSKDEQEEYQYKFGEEPNTGFGYIMCSVLGAGLIYFHIFLFYVISISTNETLLQYKDVIGSIVMQDLKLIFVFMWIMIFGMLYHAVSHGAYSYKRGKWLKKHNIKLHWWRDGWK